MDIDATVRIGKNGLTESVVEEIRAQLKKRKVIKIKFLKNTDRSDMKDKAEELAEMVGAEVVDVRGFTVVLMKVH